MQIKHHQRYKYQPSSVMNEATPLMNLINGLAAIFPIYDSGAHTRTIAVNG